MGIVGQVTSNGELGRPDVPLHSGELAPDDQELDFVGDDHGESSFPENRPILRQKAEGARDAQTRDSLLDAGDLQDEEAVCTTSEDRDFPDGGYGLVVIAACFVGKFMFGLVMCYGVFFIALLDHFGESTARTALVGSICFGSALMTGPLASFLCNLFSHRATLMLGSILSCIGYLISAFSPNMTVLYFSYGILTGTGICCMAVSSTVMPSYYFKRRRKLATAVVVTGSSFGVLVFPTIIQFCIDQYTWRGAMIITAGISLQGCVAGALLRPNIKVPMVSESIPMISAVKSTLNLITDGRFLFLFFIKTLYAFDYNVYFTLFPDRARSYGISADQAALLLSIGGISSTSTRVIMSLVVNVVKFDMNIVFAVVGTSAALPYLLLTADQLSYGVLVLVAVLQGICIGILSIANALRIVKIFGVVLMTSAYGCLLLPEGAGSIIGSPIAGFIKDVTGDYRISFIVTGVAAVVCGVLNVPLYFLCKRRRLEEANLRDDTQTTSI